MNVLVAEDDQHIRQGLVEILEREGYEVVEAKNGAEAISLCESRLPDFVCLDIMMPEMSGYDVCKQLRGRHPHLPIIFISAKSEEIDRVLGLELGADDFISKPFGVREVVARIRAVSRRVLSQAQPQQDVSAHFEIGDIHVYPAKLQACRKIEQETQTIELSLRDISILKLLHERAGEVISRDVLFDYAWGMNHMANSRSLDQHISQLRKRVEIDPKHPQIIKTVYGAGYRYEPAC